jgi:Fe-S-cluster containining protein
MSIYRKVKSIEKLFRDLDKSISDFQQKSGLKCIAGCGHCCLKPDIQATVLEFLPLAYFYYKSGIAEAMAEQLKERGTGICHVFSPVLPGSMKGSCSNYLYRGLICRLFGFSARRNKHGLPELYTCRLIKDDQPEKFQAAEKAIKEKMPVPVVSDYYTRLRSIDPVLGNEFYPINQAASKSLAIVLNYYAYRKSSPPKVQKGQSA